MTYAWRDSHLKKVVAYNQLSGAVPSQLGRLTSLQGVMHLQNNQLEGTLPTQFGLLKALSTCRVDGNRLSGAIPFQLGLLSSMGTLQIGQGNSFEGLLPSQVNGDGQGKSLIW